MELRKCIILVLLNILGVTHTQYFVLARYHGLKQDVPACINGWTEYFNTDNPKRNGYGDDDESLDRIRERHDFCIGGTITEIDCKAIINGELVDHKQLRLFGLACSKKKGLQCNRFLVRKECQDFTVRFFCECDENPPPPPPPPMKMCPEVPESFKSNCPKSCPVGNVCDGNACILPEWCPCFKNDTFFEPSSEITTKDCEICYCLPGGHSSCNPIECIECLPGQEALIDSNCICTCIGCPTGTVLCPTNGVCIKKELWCNGIVDCPDDETNCTIGEGPNCSTDNVTETNTCEMIGKAMRTFDNLPYHYEICNHVLMKELESEKYSVTVHKTCPSGDLESCHRELVIKVDKTIIRFGPGIEVISFRNEKVHVENLWLVSEKNPSLELKKIGNSLIFRSFKYHFDVTWNKAEDAKITVSSCLTNDIVGLCGFYNRRSNDDFRMPNGVIASEAREFGDSWAIGSLDVCKPPTYPPEIEKITNKTCIKLNEEPFKSSCSQYVNMKDRVDACMKFMPECLQRSDETRTSTLNGKTPSASKINECKCQAFESFVEACEIAKNGPIEEWRFQHDCSPTCPEGMVWKDCGPGCNLTCDNYRQQSKLCTSKCFPGCYCPSGLVLHQNKCVKPKMCHDCTCSGHGDPNYITFDGHYYAFQGNCTYVLAQHQSSEDSVSNFKVLAQNIECPEEPRTSCIEGLIIHWNGHVIQKQKNKPVFLGKKLIRPEDYPFDQAGIFITYEPNKNTVVYIKEINLVVRYFDLMYGFTVELPSFFYYNKTEGLCGTCNFIESDDLYHRDGYVTSDIEEFAYSWLEGPDTRKNCEFPPPVTPEPRPTVPPPGLCNFTGNPCQVILDPSAYEKSCQNDVKHSQTPKTSMCRSRFQYAQLCCERGVSLVKWLKQSGCESSCPPGMDYKCTSGCPKTCENYQTHPDDTCSLTPIFSCVCPEDEVMKAGKCVKTTECETCDSEGHVIGDEWQEGPCKFCKCLPDRSIICTLVQCAEPPVCKSTEKLEKLPPQEGSCCDIYKCVPKPRDQCGEPKLKNCPPGQANVIDESGKCPEYRCECVKHLCAPVVTPTLEEGENYSIVIRDCCPEIEITCDSKICRPPPTCNEGFKLSVQPGRCCNVFRCVPQKKVCIYQHQHNVENGIQVDLPLEDYYEKEYESGSSWQDGLCRKCSCSESNGQLGYSCSNEICQNPTDFPDAKSYVIEKEHVPGSCCPKYKRTHCISKGKAYKIGEKWQSPEGEHCKKICSCDSDRNGNAVMRTTFSCESTCQKR